MISWEGAREGREIMGQVVEMVRAIEKKMAWDAIQIGKQYKIENWENVNYDC